MLYRTFYWPRNIVRQGVGYRSRAFLAGRFIHREIDQNVLKADGRPRLSTDAPSVVNYLVGAKYVRLLLCSVFSLRASLGDTVGVAAYDDGSLTDSDRLLIGTANLGIRIVPLDEWMEPWRNQPHSSIRQVSGFYPHIMKLMLLRGLTDYAIVSDADVMYTGACEALKHHIARRTPFYLNDKQEYYGIGRDHRLVREMQVVDRLNAGYYGLTPSLVDFDKLEYVCKAYLEDPGFTYLLEQFLTAVLLTEANGSPLGPTYAMAAYENQWAGSPNMLHFANVLPAFSIEFKKLYVASQR